MSFFTVIILSCVIGFSLISVGNYLTRRNYRDVIKVLEDTRSKLEKLNSG